MKKMIVPVIFGLVFGACSSKKTIHSEEDNRELSSAWDSANSPVNILQPRSQFETLKEDLKFEFKFKNCL